MLLPAILGNKPIALSLLLFFFLGTWLSTEEFRSICVLLPYGWKGSVRTIGSKGLFKFDAWLVYICYTPVGHILANIGALFTSEHVFGGLLRRRSSVFCDISDFRILLFFIIILFFAHTHYLDLYICSRIILSFIDIFM